MTFSLYCWEEIKLVLEKSGIELIPHARRRRPDMIYTIIFSENVSLAVCVYYEIRSTRYPKGVIEVRDKIIEKLHETSRFTAIEELEKLSKINK